MSCTRWTLLASPSDAHPRLLEGLAKVAARAFKAELLELGSPLTPEILDSVLGFLLEADALHMVGRALLNRSFPTLPLSSSKVSLAIAATTEDSDCSPRLNQPGAEDEWIIWLVDCLVETMCEASQMGDELTVRALIGLCTALGGNAFAGAVCGGASRSPQSQHDLSAVGQQGTPCHACLYTAGARCICTQTCSSILRLR